jgi:hypothetical protein
MGNELPEIAAEERTPLVVALLEIIAQQQEMIQQLRDEIAILKGLKPRPKIQPSRLEQPQQPVAPPGEEGAKRPGSAKRSKNAQLTIHKTIPLVVIDAPAGSVILGYEDYIIQDLVIEAQNTC